jgi:putative heme-binding domain-containing protein
VGGFRRATHRSLLGVLAWLMSGCPLGVCGLRADDAGSQRSQDEPACQWIWGEESGADVAEVHIDRRFDVPADVTQAELHLAARGAAVEVQVNDQSVCRLEDYGPTIVVDLRRFTQAGRNELRLSCEHSRRDAAIQGRIVVKGTNTPRQVWASGPDWGTRSIRAQKSRNEESHTAAVTRGLHPNALGLLGERSIAITPFDNYEQWKQALEAGESATESFLVPPDFQVERLRTAGPDEGSWVSLEFDPQGRLLIAREDKGLWRMTLAADGSRIDRVTAIPAAAELQECRGLAFIGSDLYVNANNSKGLYRLTDSNSDGEFEGATLIREFPGSVGHGRNDLAVHKGQLYSIHGDSVDVPTTEIDDLTSPAREARQGAKTSEGQLLSFDPQANRWTLIAGGLRNPFGVAVHPVDGTFFTYDADAEHDMGAPWYRPTRIVQMHPGADFGWRGVTGKWPPYYPDHADNALPVLDIGKGSPTAVKFGYGSNFPTPWREALYVLDWAYGRVLAVQLGPRGAGYMGGAEVFLRGRPLNVTDLGFGPDGAMYLVTGGRKTQSTLYRVRYTGPAVESPTSPVFAVETRRDWDDLNSLDPVRRYQARLALERAADGGPAWRDRALAESRPLAAFTALIALARVGDARDRGPIVQRIGELLTSDLTASEKLSALQACRLAAPAGHGVSPDVLDPLRSKLESLYPDAAPLTFTPVGLGGPVNHRLAELLVELESPVVIERTLSLLRAAESQEERMHYLHVLRGVRVGWNAERHREFFGALNELESRYHGGRGMSDFLKSLREDAIARLSTAEQTELATLLHPAAAPADEPLPSRPLVREWKVEDIESLAKGALAGDAAEGLRLFRAAVCSRCHRVGTEGSSFGPDLTGVAGRFSRADILRSIIDPAAVVAEIYRNVEIVTTDGRVLTGQVVTSGDYRDTVLRLQTDPLRLSQVVEISKSEIELHRESRTSPMPSGLLNTLTAEEVQHLLAYLQGGSGVETATGAGR